MAYEPQVEISNHIRTVAAIGQDGGKIPAEYTKIADAWRAAHADGGNSHQDAFTAAIIAGNTDEIGRLRVEAAIERLVATNSQATAAPMVASARPVLAALKAAYEPEAVKNYERAAKLYNTAAGALADAAAIADINAPADVMVNAPAPQREAWGQATILTLEVDEAAERLRRAATGLLGLGGNVSEPLALAMVVDTTGIHRRRLWEAWDAVDGRTGRWGAILRLGAKLRAASADSLVGYERPGPVEETWEPGAIGQRRVLVDPADAEFARAR